MDEIVTITDAAELRRLYEQHAEGLACAPVGHYNGWADETLLASIPAVADRIEELEGALCDIAFQTEGRAPTDLVQTVNLIACHTLAALAQPRVDGPTETPDDPKCKCGRREDDCTYPFTEDCR